MSEYSKLILKLMELGFTEYESKVYLTLLTKGPLYASELALYSGVPRTKIYEAIKGLMKKQLVEAYGSPKKFSVTANPEPFETILAEEERKYKEVKSLINEVKDLSQKNGITQLKGNLQILGEDALDNVFNDFLKRVRYSLYIIADQQIFQLLKKHEKQLMSLMLSEINLNILISYNDEDMINEAVSLDLPVRVGKLFDQKGMVAVDEEVFLIHNPETGASTVIIQPYIVKLIIENSLKKSFDGSLELKEYIKFLHTGFSEDLINLKVESDAYRIFFYSALKTLKEDELKKISYKMLESYKAKTNIFEAEARSALPAFVELIKTDIKNGEIKYDETTKMITVELEDSPELPPSPWFFMMKAYLNSQGKDLEKVASINGEKKTILQFKVPWEIEDILF
ncbi:MAG: helix-turn-helix domain-containing protein [Nitrososphaeria archaeon]|jgi:Predicted transcriptional regulators